MNLQTLQVICVYTSNFLDLDDVKRVRHELGKMGLGQTLYYKTVSRVKPLLSVPLHVRRICDQKRLYKHVTSCSGAPTTRVPTLSFYAWLSSHSFSLRMLRPTVICIMASSTGQQCDQPAGEIFLISTWLAPDLINSKHKRVHPIL